MNTYTQLGNRLLQPWHTIKIDKRGNNKHVIFTSRIHMRKEVELTFCFADTFSDCQILHDQYVINKFYEMYGIDGVK
jgi:hypothetical protein